MGALTLARVTALAVAFGVALGVALGLPARAHAQRVIIEAPDAANADGEAVIAVTVKLASATGERAPRIALDVDLGAIAPAQPPADRAAGFAWTVPRLANGRTATLAATVRLGRRTLRATRQVALAPAPDMTPPRRSLGPLDLHGPEHIRLSASRPYEISIRKPAGALPQLVASAGTVSPWRDSGDGRVRASYIPPRRRSPGVAIVAAVSRDRRVHDWIAIPLLADAVVDLDSRPEVGVSVAVHVGGAVFGPIRTDRRGLAKLLVLVPPGVPAAETVATDRHGNLERDTLPLDPAPVDRLLLVCPRTNPRALVFAVTPAGAPAPDAALASIAVTATRGRVDLEPLGGGALAALYDAPDDALGGQPVTLEARVGGDVDGDNNSEGDSEGDAAAARCDMRIPGEPPDGYDFALDPPRYVAGAGERVRVSITPRYSGRLPPLPVPPRVVADFGSISSPVRGPDGTFTAAWSIPDAFEGRTAAALTVADAVAPAAELKLVPGALAHVRVVPGSSRLVADGAQHTEIVVAVTDDHGNPIPGVALEPRARGRTERPIEREPGVFTVRYTAPRLHEQVTDAVSFRVTAVGKSDASPADLAIEGRAPILLENVERPLYVAARAGYLSNAGKVGGPLIAAEAAFRLPIGRAIIAIGGEASIYASSHTAAADTMEPVDIALTAVPLLVRATASRTLGRLAPYLGIGAGVVVDRVRVDAPSAGSVVTSGAELAMLGVAGVQVALTDRHALVFELAYLNASSSDDDVTGNLGGYTASAGYRFSP